MHGEKGSHFHFTSIFILDFFYYLAHVLALLLGMRTIFCNMPDRNNNNCLIALTREELLHLIGIVIAYPAGSKSTLGGCQTKMLCSDGYINISMRLLIISANPVFIHVFHAHDIHRCCFKPLTIVAFLQFLLSLCRTDDEPMPRLSVNGRRCQLHTLHDIIQILLAYSLRGKLTSRESLLTQ